jgi:hypothetical protein
LFESWSYILSGMDEDSLDQLVSKRKNLLDRFQKEFQNTEYLNALKSGDQYSVAKRIEMTKAVVKEII